MRRNGRFFAEVLAWLGAAVAWSVCLVESHAAVKARVYPMGDEDIGISVGETVILTDDIEPGPTMNIVGDPVSDSGGVFVPLESLSDPTAPRYVVGREGDGSFAVDFDGVDDLLFGAAFDPRDFDPGSGWQFNALSQGWIKPDPAGMGREQVVWQLGSDNGTVAISDTGFWKLISGGNAEDLVTSTPVEFDEWTHVAVFRGGNDGRIYINGQLAGVSGGFWNVTGEMVVGGSIGRDRYFDGAVDDFNISGFSDRSFVLANDIDFFAGIVSGVPGDVDQDGDVDVDDYKVWSDNVGFDNGLGAGDPFTLMRGDLDQNGRVNYFDFELLKEIAANQGTPLPLSLVPEPSSAMLGLAGLSLLAVLRRRSR